MYVDLVLAYLVAQTVSAYVQELDVVLTVPVGADLEFLAATEFEWLISEDQDLRYGMSQVELSNFFLVMIFRL